MATRATAVRAMGGVERAMEAVDTAVAGKEWAAEAKVRAVFPESWLSHGWITMTCHDTSRGRRRRAQALLRGLRWLECAQNI